MRRIGALALIGLLLATCPVAPKKAWGQLAVIDASAVFQLAMSVREQIELVAQGTRDLAPFVERPLLIQEVTKLVALGGKLHQIGTKLSARESGWQALTSLSQRPKTLAELDTWVFQSQTWAIEGAREASGALNVLGDAVEFVNTAISILDRVPSISGTVGGLQTVNASLSSLSGHLAGLQGMIAPFHQVLLGQQMIKDVAAHVWRESIAVHHMSDWGQGLQ